MRHCAFTRTRRFAVAALACCIASFASTGWAEDGAKYPSRPITWIVGYVPGGSVDAITRVIAHQLELSLGQTVIVENRPGATGSIALRAVEKAPADGYTLVTVPGPVISRIPMPQLGKELEPIALLAQGATVLVGTARPDAPQDLKALLADAKAHPGKYSFASSGNGTGQHLTGELINVMAGTKITHVPYKGGGQAVTDVVGGQIPLAVLGITPVLAHIRSGKLKAYGISTAKRSAALPDVPTLAEAGLPGFDAPQWFVLAAPKGLPAARAAKLNAAVAEALKRPEVLAHYDALGVFAAPASPQETASFVKRDLARWADLVRTRHLPLQ